MCMLCSGSPADRSSFAREIAQLHGGRPTNRRTQSKATLGLSEEQLEAGAALLRQVPSVDVHSHPARFFLRGLTQRTSFAHTLPPLSLDTAAQEMTVGGVSTVLFAAVVDYPLLDSRLGGLQAIRGFHPGEAISEYKRQLGILQGLVREQLLPQARDARDIAQSHARGQAACMFSIEGGDFIEDRLERISRAFCNGVRVVTVIHYHTNQIGDTQTESPSHGGLTAVGREIIREMQRTGVIVDLAHASYETSRDAVDISTRPMLISHTNLNSAKSNHPRLISAQHARMVTQAGGVIGAVAAGFGQESLSDYIDTILHMVELLGVDHVAIGTDLDFTYEPVFTTYLDWRLLPAALLARGLNRDEVAKVMGGNFIRVLRANGPS